MSDDRKATGKRVSGAVAVDGSAAEAASSGGDEASARSDAVVEAGALTSDTAVTVFRLHGRFLEMSELLARPAGLTAAWWQVLGAVLREPLPAAGIARAMGMTRQGVQRVADLLVEKGLAEYRPNPAHKRAKLLTPTEEGRAAIAKINPGHRELSEQLTAELGVDGLRACLESLRQLNDTMERITDSWPRP
ncbi:MarR family winged helix-turn-helix transcriptional regulator [Nonomuraea sp. NPDC048826]|uniref:MarR family winged helix-turn-helix transcriptional regulator n=1 Tax=Nonomuraea sp. NPDC048826 TaxID=3364347 RepID=UPI00371E88AF